MLKKVNGTYVDSNSTHNIADIAGGDPTRGTDKKSVRIKLPTVVADFDVFQGTSSKALAEAIELISGTSKVINTLSSPLDSLSGLTLKPSSTVNLTDANGNALNFVGPLTITN